MRRAPGSCLQHDPGARLYPCCQGRTPTKLPAEAKSTPGSPGRGFLCAILADPQTNARAGRNPSLKILPDSSPHASARSRPTTAPAASPSCGRPSPTPPRRSRPGSMPLVSITNYRRRGTGGATVNSPTFRYPMPAADPRTGRGEGAPPETRYQHRWPLRRPPARHRRRPQAHPDRPAGARGPVLLRPGRCQLLARRRCARRPGPSPPGHRPTGLAAGSRTSATSAGSSSRANPTGRLIHLTCKEPDWPRPVPAPTPERRRTAGGRAPAHGGVERRRTPTET